MVLGALVHLADLAPAPRSFDVFAADPIDATPEPPIITPSPPALPRPRPVVPPREHRTHPGPSTTVAAPRSASPRVAGGASRTLPEQPPAAPISRSVMPALTPDLPDLAAISSAADLPASPPDRTEPLAVAPDPVEPPASPLVGGVLTGPARADVLRPVPEMPRTGVAALSTGSAREVVAPAIEQQSADPRLAAPATTVPTPEPVPPPSPGPVHVAERAAGATPAAPAGVEPLPSPAEHAEPVARSLSEPRPAGRGPSALGLDLGVGRLRIRLDGDAVRTTDRETDIISGTLVGGRPARVVVQVDERISVPTLAGRAFATAVTLSPGVNRVRVQAIDAQGREVEEVVTIQYNPPVASNVTITSPRDGHTLGPGDPPLVIVQGEVADPGLGAVWIVANDRRVMVPVTSGRFRAAIPVLEPIVRVRAESGGEDRHSATVTIDGRAALPAVGLFLEDWPGDTSGPAQLTVMWRANPARLDGGAHPLPLSALPLDGESGSRFFYLPKARPGVYTFVLTHRTAGGPVVHPVLSVAGASRSLKPVTFEGPGRAVVTRLLLPQGVVWEQDDWFTGRSASGDTITKFRFPEGVSWMERVEDPAR
jgi:hypothetical protein